jgi:hypothetical protein
MTAFTFAGRRLKAVTEVRALHLTQWNCFMSDFFSKILVLRIPDVLLLVSCLHVCDVEEVAQGSATARGHHFRLCFRWLLPDSNHRGAVRVLHSGIVSCLTSFQNS